jgi:hypothetical protein
MTMRWPYKLVPSPQPILSLGGRWVRLRPIVVVTLIGPTGTVAREAQVDSAADDTVFPEDMAAMIGLDLTQAPRRSASGVGLVPVPVRYAETTFRITDGREQREWRGWVGFTNAALKRPLLGFAGFLQFFTTNLVGDREALELSVNSLYQGT